jgi:LuxR family maltose regulon positive regulatory protein
MPNTLLSTKLYIPHPKRELVHRPRLIERLHTGMARKLTLISAPAGYGKTTLVSDWIARSQVPAAWLSLDASDNDVGRFFNYVIAALQGVHPDIGSEIRPILESEADPPIEHLLTALVNDIAVSAKNMILILDDYHVIREIKIHHALSFLLDHIPPGTHVVITSRTDPPMPLGRLRVRRELTEIRESDLRFALEETTAFLNDLTNLGLSRSDIKTLVARTEGWIAGLQLAALTLQGCTDKHDLITTFSGSHRHLIDYLVYEVMSRQPEEVRAFLLHTSILKQFNGSLCDALMLQSNSKEILLTLEASNLFLIPLDNERRWYRYHHLFADFLRQRLRETEPEIIPELYVRASQWYEDNRMLDEAIERALDGNDTTRAARLLDENVETFVLVNGEITSLLRWTDRVPADVRARFPRLCIYHALALLVEYRLDAVEPTLALAEAHLAEPETLPETFAASQITGLANMVRIRAAQQRGDYARSVELALATLRALPKKRGTSVLRGVLTTHLGMGYFGLGHMENAHRFLHNALVLNQQTGIRYAALVCIECLMLVEIARGAPRQARENGEKGLHWIEEWSRPEASKRRPIRMLAHLRLGLGRVLYEMNDLTQATEVLNQCTAYYELVRSQSRISGYLLLVDLYQALGDVETALGYLRKLEHISVAPGFSLPGIPLGAQIAERSLRLSQLRPELNDLFAKAVRWAETSGLRVDDEFRYQREYEYLTLARVLIAQDKVQEAIPLLDRLIVSAETAGRMGELITNLSLQAVAHQTQGSTDVALSYLSRALTIGEPEGYVRTFVDLGPPMRDLLRAVIRQGLAADYVSTLLAAFGLPVSGMGVTRENLKPDSLIEPLNDRELQILHRMAVRLSNQEIADELHLTVNTVKWYARNIYGKLGVGKRTEAVSRARELGIL